MLLQLIFNPLKKLPLAQKHVTYVWENMIVASQVYAPASFFIAKAVPTVWTKRVGTDLTNSLVKKTLRCSSFTYFMQVIKPWSLQGDDLGFSVMLSEKDFELRRLETEKRYLYRDNSISSESVARYTGCNDDIALG